MNVRTAPSRARFFLPPGPPAAGAPEICHWLRPASGVRHENDRFSQLAGDSPGAGAFDLGIGAVTRVGVHLNDGFQPGLVVVIEPDEAKGLQRPGARAEHFRGPKHHSGPGQKHQCPIASGVNRMS